MHRPAPAPDIRLPLPDLPCRPGAARVCQKRPRTWLLKPGAGRSWLGQADSAAKRSGTLRSARRTSQLAVNRTAIFRSARPCSHEVNSGQHLDTISPALLGYDRFFGKREMTSRSFGEAFSRAKIPRSRRWSVILSSRGSPARSRHFRPLRGRPATGHRSNPRDPPLPGQPVSNWPPETGHCSRLHRPDMIAGDLKPAGGTAQMPVVVTRRAVQLRSPWASPPGAQRGPAFSCRQAWCAGHAPTASTRPSGRSAPA